MEGGVLLVKVFSSKGLLPISHGMADRSPLDEQKGRATENNVLGRGLGRGLYASSWKGRVHLVQQQPCEIMKVGTGLR